jgi:hypothetical protein
MINKTRKPNKNCKFTKSLSLQIRRLYLSGLNITQILDKLDISSNTWDAWYNRNTQGFRDNFIQWRREKMLGMAERNLHEFLDMPTDVQKIEDEDGVDRAIIVTDPRLVKIKLDATAFGLETIGKEFYSKKVLQEDPNAARKEDIDELRKMVKTRIYNAHKRIINNRDKLRKIVKNAQTLK